MASKKVPSGAAAFWRKIIVKQKGTVEIQPFELLLQQQGYQRIAGVDEAGRGPLAGPVVASAVILPFNCLIPGLTDSKQLTPRQHDRLYLEIQHSATAIGIGCVDNEAIDRLNILQATMLAMRQAIEQISPPPDYVLVDGTQLPPISLPAEAIPKGDSLCQSIAAGSIIAKVTRDRQMVELDRVYPHYGFQRHKGYGTPQHRQAIAKFGLCPIHRRSFKLQ
jgi:ribonuclease HII